MKMGTLIPYFLVLLLGACRKGPEPSVSTPSKLIITVNFRPPELLLSNPGSEWLVNYIRTAEIVDRQVVFDLRLTLRDETIWCHSLGDGHSTDCYRESLFTISQLKDAKTAGELFARIGHAEADISPLNAEGDGVKVWQICNVTTNVSFNAYQIFAGINATGKIQCLFMSSGEAKLTPMDKR